MAQDDKVPTFPFVPNKLSRRAFRVFEPGDFAIPEDVESLIYLMWQELETDFYYYHPTEATVDAYLLTQRDAGDFRMDETERRFYKHPKYQRDYIRIAPVSGRPKWDWERELVDKDPEFWRITMSLSAMARTELDTKHKIELEEHFRLGRRKARYAFDAFLSYATANTAEAELVHAKASAAGLKVFMAPKHLVPGDDFAEAIRSALEGAAELWLLLSPQSARSEWVISEWGAAWVLRIPIVPFCISVNQTYSQAVLLVSSA